ncbi:MAG: orotate phosphoribosyltransferase [Vagococcus sp.]
MKQVAEHLLNIKAVALNPNEPFVWASGMKSPIYCDNRMTMGYPEVRQEIAKALATQITERYPDVEVIAGTATAGIPHAAWVADILNLPMIYIRGKAKGHGKKNQIEGKLTPNQKIVIIEDLISTGGSVIDATEAAKESGGNVLGVGAIFTYELPKGIANFESHQLPYFTLTTYSELIEVALENKYIEEKDSVLLEKWKNDPENWLKV